MVLIHGVNFHVKKPVVKVLKHFHGLGPVKASQIMAKFSIHKLAKVESLGPKMITSLSAELSQMTIGTDFKRTIQENIGRLRAMGTYRGRRHAMGLPVRGQRSRKQTSTANKFNKVERTL